MISFFFIAIHSYARCPHFIWHMIPEFHFLFSDHSDGWLSMRARLLLKESQLHLFQYFTFDNNKYIEPIHFIVLLYFFFIFIFIYNNLANSFRSLDVHVWSLPWDWMAINRSQCQQICVNFSSTYYYNRLCLSTNEIIIMSKFIKNRHWSMWSTVNVWHTRHSFELSPSQNKWRKSIWNKHKR